MSDETEHTFAHVAQHLATTIQELEHLHQVLTTHAPHYTTFLSRLHYATVLLKDLKLALTAALRTLPK